MPCSLTKSGIEFDAATGAVVTIKLKAKSTTQIVDAEYNDASIPVTANGTTFTVVSGPALLFLFLAGPPDTVEILEDCGGGKTQHLFGYKSDFHPALGFKIAGAP
ncbi:MAG TPA: hypothetical protein VIE43_27255 [Thermoanaerobaculia bacterium]|jgi:hypothetical protein|nr:hypothetical protein [Thermoanaerobaculia bacterium]